VRLRRKLRAVSGTGAAAGTRTFDVSEVLPGIVEESAFKRALEGHEWTAYRGAQVVLTGCAPLWTYVFVAARLAPHAGGITIDDGSESGVRVL
jgi:hypothetical protein